MNKNPKVFGTFGVELDPQEFEFYDPKHNIYNINLVPDCRVFIFGMDVTPDIINVNVSKQLNAISRCSITLSNPRGKFVIQRNDLRKKWREDKDILDAYTFDMFKKQYPKEWYSKVIALAGSSIEATYQYAADLFKKAGSQQVISSRMLYETKFYSGMDKKVGETVFDYRDPVQVFFKGRFSPYWYFGFSGVVTGIDDSAAYGESETISLECQDLLHLWDKQHLMTRSSMLPAGRFELERLDVINKKTGTNQGYNIQSVKTYSFNKYIQLCAFGFGDVGSIFNNNLIINNISDFGKDTDNEKLVKNSANDADFENDNRIDYFLWSMAQNGTADDNLIKTRENIRDIFKTCNMFENSISNKLLSYTQLNYMFSQRSFIGNKIPHPGGKVHQGSNDFNTNEGPNVQRLSSWQLVYMQLFKIAPKALKTQNEIPKWYESSLRFWEKNPTIPQKAGEAPNSTTGWVDGDYFCVAGTHPAMTYEFLNNFSILPHIWSQVNKSIGNSYAPMDKLIVSPADKIRESIAGSPTEYTVNSTSGTASTLKHANFFRPRVFALLPRRYNSEKSANIGQFLNLSLTETDTLSSFGAMLEVCKKSDYVIYTSNMGDIFIEPELYDTHPKLYMEPTQYKNFYCEASNIPDPDIEYRSPSAVNLSNTIKSNKFVSWFGERSVHPQTVMLKDECRCTQTFTADQMATSVEVRTALTDLGESNGNAWMGGIEADLQSTLADTQQQLTVIDFHSNNLKQFRNFKYVANGLADSVFEEGMDNTIDNAIDKQSLMIKKDIVSYLIDRSGKSDYTFFSFLKEVESTYYYKFYSTKVEADKNTNYIYTNILKQNNLGADNSNKVCGLTEAERKALSADDLKTVELAESLTLVIHNARRDIINNYYDVKLWGETDKTSLEYKVYSLKVERSEIQTRIKNLYVGNAVVDNATSTALSAELKACDAKIVVAESNLAVQEQNAWRNFDSLLLKKVNDKTVASIYYTKVLKDILNVIAPDMLSLTSLSSNTNGVKSIIIDTADVSKCTKLVDMFGSSFDSSKSTFYAKLAAGATSSTVASNFSNSGTLHRTMYACLIPLFRDTVLCQDATTKADYEELRRLFKTSNVDNISAIVPRTLGDLKLLALSGRYTPSQDLMRLYGYNPAPPKTFFYVQQALAGRHYAMMYLNQYLGQAFTMQLDIIGRPELHLNRPMYVASKDAIGTLNNYTFTYSCGDLFNSHIALNYIRKNALTYEYSLGHYLDSLPFNSNVNQNTDFAARASNYYKFLAALKGLNNIASAINGSIGTIVSADTVSKVTKTIADKVLSNDYGLHSFHGEIGQIELDKRMTEDGGEKTKTGELTPTGVNPYDKAEFRSLLSTAEAKMTRRDECLTAYNNNTNDINKYKSLKDSLSSSVPSASNIPTNLNGFFVISNDLSSIDGSAKISDILNVTNIAAKTTLLFGSTGVNEDDPVFSVDTLTVMPDTKKDLTMEVYTDYTWHKGSSWNVLDLGKYTKTSTYRNLIDKIKTALSNCGFSATEVKSPTNNKVILSIIVTSDSTAEDSSQIVFNSGNRSITDILRVQRDTPNLMRVGIQLEVVKSANTKYSLCLKNYMKGNSYIVDIDAKSISTISDLISVINSKSNKDTFPAKASLIDGAIVFESIDPSIQIWYSNTPKKESNTEYIPSILSCIPDIVIGNNIISVQNSRISKNSSKVTACVNSIFNLERNNSSLLTEISSLNRELYGSQTFDINTYKAATVTDDLSKWSLSYFENADASNNIIKVQKQSLFGQLLLNACTISGLPNWKIDYMADYATDTGDARLKKYIKSTETEVITKFNTVQKFVWQTGDSEGATADSIVFKNAYPTTEHVNRLISLVEGETDIGKRNKKLHRLYDEVLTKGSSVDKFQSKIKEVVDCYQKTPDTYVSIMGFTCRSYKWHSMRKVWEDPKAGTYDAGFEAGKVYNQGLSERRAKFIASLLTYGYEQVVGSGKFINIPWAAIARVIGVGWEYDFLMDKSNKGNPKNRRVEIYITKKSTAKIVKDYTVWEDWNTKEFVNSED